VFKRPTRSKNSIKRSKKPVSTIKSQLLISCNGNIDQFCIFRGTMERGRRRRPFHKLKVNVHPHGRWKTDHGRAKAQAYRHQRNGKGRPHKEHYKSLANREQEKEWCVTGCSLEWTSVALAHAAWWITYASYIGEQPDCHQNHKVDERRPWRFEPDTKEPSHVYCGSFSRYQSSRETWQIHQ